jgi:signal transduction histidine kinase
VDDRVDAWRPLAEHTGLRLERTGVRGLTAVAPEGALETVLDAVLDNAVKFSPPDATITVHTAADGDRVEVAVRDRGPGLEPDELSRATDRFWRSPAQSNVEGSGLGLAIAARTLELGGGRLGLELPDDGGLRVVAQLRRVPEPAAVDQAAVDQSSLLFR